MGRYKKLCETKENHQDAALITRYYKVNFQQAFDVVEEILRRDPMAKIISKSPEHGEISADIGNGSSFLVCTVITIKPYTTAVDFVLSTEKLSILGTYPLLKRKVVSLYESLGERLPLLK
ncbi:hypothetical protein [Bacillus massilinigeriensis]|uniref:hypothetical protein n=1 Tax=Bacillus mediterraneensis TaxID=1805474 RepID=UPI0008F92751|nr:hypothetical protein [Bacillus mediterraneensis]